MSNGSTTTKAPPAQKRPAIIYVDYKGTVNASGERHIGPLAICANRPSDLALILQPGINPVDPEVWRAMGSTPAIGLTEGGQPEGSMFGEGRLSLVAATHDGHVDWAKYTLSDLQDEHGVMRRTTAPLVLEHLIAYLRKKAADTPSAKGWQKCLEDAERHLDDICTSFDGKTKVDPKTAEGRIRRYSGAITAPKDNHPKLVESLKAVYARDPEGFKAALDELGKAEAKQSAAS